MDLSPCKKHNRMSCWEHDCQQDNAGRVGIDTQGDLTMGVGSGIGIDLTDGSIVIGGIDTDGK